MDISSETLPAVIQDGLNGLFGIEYNNVADEYTEIYTQESSTREFEEYQGFNGFPNAPIKPAGHPTEFLETSQQYKQRATHVVVSAAWAMTKELMTDNRYGDIARRYLAALALSMKQSKEILAATIFNQAYSTNFRQGDGQPLLSNSNPGLRATWSNIFGSDGLELTDQTLKAVLTQLKRMETGSGQNAGLMDDKLLIPPELEFKADEITMSALQADTMNNNRNSIRGRGRLPGGIVINRYLTSPDNWFVLTNCPMSFIYLDRWPLENKMEGDFLSDTAQYKSSARYSFLNVDKRGIVGPPNA